MEQNQNELLDQLNRFTRRSHSLDEVYIFDLILCDNEIDRDGDCFSMQALAELQKRFVGVTGIFDHDPRSGNQTARIFRTALRRDPERRTKAGQEYCCLTANAYMVRTERNSDLIREIEGGIKKEVSISCACGKRVCSVCGKNHLQQPCTHIKGRVYGGTLCYTTLDDVNDVYEWSFVAVPAQRRAGVTKTLGGQADAETEILRRAYGDALRTVDQLSEAIRRDVVRLCYRWGDNACAKALADSALHMDAAQLLTLRQSLQKGAAPAAGKPILPENPHMPAKNGLSAFSLGSMERSEDAHE